MSHRVVIVGGGFGGLEAARTLKDAPVQVTVIDRRNFHLFQPLLYQVATGGLSPANIAAPLRAILKRQKNTGVLLGEVTGIDTARRDVHTPEGPVPYDSLIVATGVRHQYFGHPEWEQFAPGLKTIEDATAIRRRVLMAFEAAERETDPDAVRAWLTFVVIGGGPTGVEMAGAIAEIARFTLRGNFRRIDPTQARVVLVERLDRVLPSYPAGLSRSAQRSLEEFGVELHLKRSVLDIAADRVTLSHADDETATDTIPTHTVVWAAGVQGSPLGRQLAEATGAELDRFGRVIVNPDLTLPGHPEIFVIGDLANFGHQTGEPLPGVAQVAIQQGRYAARLIRGRLKGETSAAAPKPFRYTDLGSMATIGRAAAVADLRFVRLTGFLGWLSWLFVHLMRLVYFQNRILVFAQWAWSYFTRNRAARLITGYAEQPEGLEVEPAAPVTAAVERERVA
ncbi:MAG: NAD(P)/FAD-dependent oxidoreductase [Anaerolineae bacterium]|nr:NAD(P)/FAD-dependent oxidoreductase [Anaerolineae bacterium]